MAQPISFGTDISNDAQAARWRLIEQRLQAVEAGVAKSIKFNQTTLGTTTSSVFDGLGRINIMTLIASVTTGPLSTVGTVADQAVATVNFTLTSAKSVFLIGLANGYVLSTGGGPFLESTNLYLQVTGQSASAKQAMPQIVSPAAIGASHTGSATMAQVLPSLLPKVYTANLYWIALNGVNDQLQIANFTILVFQLGN